ncbi:NAS2 [Sanghuangporus sanghuang]
MGYTLPPPSGPSSNAVASSSSSQDAINSAQTLIAQKSAIESALSDQLAILQSQNADMSTPLVDRAGFPRADMDIVAVRTARVRILELRNDLNAIFEEVKVALERVHEANAAEAARRREEDANDAMDQDEAEELLTPFARVDGVAPGSPAATAGLQREDLILAFGSLTLSGLSTTVPSAAPSRLAPLAALASSHEDRPLQLRILRASEPLNLTLIPRKWGGRGLIGCHIVPYTPPP